MPTQDYRDADNQKIPGVTTILIEDQEGLITAANLLGLKGTRVYHSKDQVGTWSLSTDIGTCCHGMIEAHLRGIPFDPESLPPEIKARGEDYVGSLVRLSHPAYGSFLAWRQGKTLEGECEVSLTHPDGFGGTIDFVHKSEILDWKTGSNFMWKNPAKLYGQLAAYKYLAEHHGHRVDKVTVVRFPKEGTPAEELVIEPGPKLDAGLDMFKALLQAWKARQIINRKDKK